MRKFAVLLTALLVACSSPSSQAPAPESTAVVVVKNQAWELMRVYVLDANAPGTPFRIGEVEAGQTRRLLVRVHPGVDIRFLYVPLADSRTYTTEPVELQAGDELDLHIESYLPFSSIFLVRR
jgi:hypothetical protein